MDEAGDVVAGAADVLLRVVGDLVVDAAPVRAVRGAQCRRLSDRESACGLPGRPKLLITPIFHDFSRFFPVFPGTSGRAPWIPGVQTLKMGERWGKMGKKWVKNGITGVQKTALMHASAGPALATTLAQTAPSST